MAVAKPINKSISWRDPVYPAAFPKQERINIHGPDPVTCNVLTIYGGDSQLITQSRLDHPLGGLFRPPDTRCRLSGVQAGVCITHVKCLSLKIFTG